MRIDGLGAGPDRTRTGSSSTAATGASTAAASAIELPRRAATPKPPPGDFFAIPPAPTRRMKETQLDLGRYFPYEANPGIGRWKYEKRLPLTTAGQLRIAPIGVGSAFSTRNYQSNFIFIKGNAAVFCDLGSTAMVRLIELGLSSHDVRDLIVTHSHADHIGSLEELALRRRYEAPYIEMPKSPVETAEQYNDRIVEARRTGTFRPNLYVPEQYGSDLWEMSLRGGLAFSEEVDFLGPRGMMQLDHYFNPTFLPYDRNTQTWSVEIKGIKVKVFLTQHVPDTAADSGMFTSGMVIDDRLFISGDTKFDPENIERYAKGCEVLFHDCQHFPGGVHAYYNDLKTLPADVKAKMYLYHLSDGMLNIDVKSDGFAGLLRPAPTVYDFE